jgi:predicted ATPase
MEEVNEERIKYDEEQYKIIKKMSKLESILDNYFRNKSENRESADSSAVPCGLYIWGEVGTGMYLYIYHNYLI